MRKCLNCSRYFKKKDRGSSKRHCSQACIREQNEKRVKIRGNLYLARKRDQAIRALLKAGKPNPLVVRRDGTQTRKYAQGSATKIQNSAFYMSEAWRAVRYQALIKYGRKCQCCGAEPPAKMHVDHIKPRSLFPSLELDLRNLQILCEDCNMGKSNRDQTDFRPKL